MYMMADQFVQSLKCRRIASVDAKEEEAPDIDVDYIVDEKAVPPPSQPAAFARPRLRSMSRIWVTSRIRPWSTTSTRRSGPGV